MNNQQQHRRLAPWREKLHEVIFEADTPLGKAFDVMLLVAIMVSVLIVVLESVEAIGSRFGPQLVILEWVFTGLFTLEYVLRLIAVRSPTAYARSFFGVVDVLAVLPTFASLLVPGAQSLLVIRALRLLRIFRVFKVARYLGELTVLIRAIRATKAKITVFLLVMMTMVLIMGAGMYVIEGSQPGTGFTSIPRGIYWAIVTLTTVGYGDIAPQTRMGQMVAAVAMILGYSLIIIPTGIFSVELVQAAQKKTTTQCCSLCMREGHDEDATFCKYCGAGL